jgi:hypothetical protein
MSTLTALKLERELDLTRRAIETAMRRPELVMKWGINSETGRPEAYWAVVGDTAPASVVTLPEFF